MTTKPTNRHTQFSALSVGSIALTLAALIIIAVSWGAIEYVLEAVVAAVVFPVLGVTHLTEILKGGTVAGGLRDLVLSACAGILAGFATAVIRAWGGKRFRLQPFLSSAIDKDLMRPLSSVFIGKVLIGGLVGLVVGVVCGSTGAPSVTHLFSGTAHEPLTNYAYPISDLMVGPSGGGGGLHYWGSSVFVVLVLILMGLVVGVVSGYAVQITLAAVCSMTKGAAKEWMTAIMTEGMTDEYSKPLPMRAGAIRGLWTGLMVGTLMAFATIVNIVRFFEPQ